MNCKSQEKQSLFIIPTNFGNLAVFTFGNAFCQCLWAGFLSFHFENQLNCTVFQHFLAANTPDPADEGLNNQLNHS